MHTSLIIVIAVILAGIAGSVWMRKLTLPAALTGGLIGILLFLGTGWTGLLEMTAFFILGTAATSWKRSVKEQWKLAENKKGRNAGQVLANAGVAAIAAFIAWQFPQHQPVCILIAASAFSSAAADTVSSEMGSVYGKFFFNILSFKKDQRGLDGVVSVQGFLWGCLGSLVIAALYALTNGWNQNFIIIILAGTIGNIADSILGATLERKGWIKNDAVNFLNTAMAALVGLWLV